MIKDLESAYRTHFLVREPFLDASLHKEVLEVARQNHYLIFHFGDLIAKFALCATLIFLIEFVQLVEAEPLQLEDIVPILKYGEFGVGIKTSTKAHKDPALISH